jgi:3-hydroxybutyryl-CoA dehydrogenase
MEIKAIAIVGAGTMGRGIAYCSALAGYRTILEDASDSMLEQGLEYIRRALDEGISRGKVTEEQKKNSLACVVTARSVQDACREADLIIEAVPEEMETKLEIFTLLDKFAKPGAIFASNTSSLSITEMAAITFHAENCIGMHFFNPVQKMKLLEIVRGLETCESALSACVEVGRRMGKEVVVVRESPGFVTSRINAMIGNEAFYMLQEGVATAGDIDKALKLGLNHPMGPFELVDLVGLDVRLSILQHLHRTLGEKYRPCPLLEQYVKAGRLGRKSGRGVYDYKETAGSAKT